MSAVGKVSGPRGSTATKLLLLKGPDVYVCLRAVAVCWPVVFAG